MSTTSGGRSPEEISPEERRPEEADVSTSPAGTPTGNPLDPLARPGVDASQTPHTGTTAPPHEQVAPHDAVVTPEEQEAARAARAVQADQSPRATPPAGGAGEPVQGGTDPDPTDTPGLAPGGGVQPGDTPPAAEGTHTSLARNEKLPGGRTRLVVPISIVAVLAILFAAFFLGQLGVFG